MILALWELKHRVSYECETPEIHNVYAALLGYRASNPQWKKGNGEKKLRREGV